MCHSPDPFYNEKMQAIKRARGEAEQAPGRIVFLHQDEHTANVRPLEGRTTARKATGAVDVATGQVPVQRWQTFNVKEMYRFFYHLEQHYPEAEVIYVALDNWPVHSFLCPAPTLLL